MRKMKVSQHVTLLVLDSREEWLQCRTSRIGGSDAGAIIGENKYKSNIELWQEKTGRIKPEDISQKPFVKYGNDAEPLLRELFKLDNPEYQMGYFEHNMFLNDKYPWAHASLDGWLKDQSGRMGVWENKTVNIQNGAQVLQWRDGVPGSYLAQIIHYMAVTEFDFTIINAQLKYLFGDFEKRTIHRLFEADTLREDMMYLMDKEYQFMKFIEADREPPLQLNIG